MNVTRYAWFIALLAPLQWGFISMDSLRDQVDEANSLFDEGYYQDAIERYMDIAAERAPTAHELRFNAANAWYREGDYARAIENYRNAISGLNPALDSKAYYGIGNAWFQQQNYAQAIDQYIESLRRNPMDEDAKYNLELARRLLEEELQEQEQQQQDQDQEQDEQDEQDQDQESDQNQDQESSSNDDQQDREDGEHDSERNEDQEEPSQEDQNDEPEQDDRGEQDQQESPQPDELTLEEALQLLENFAESEQDRRRVIQRQTGPRVPVDQDW